MIDDSARTLWQVVRNSAGRYSVWPVASAIPDGWGTAGVTATKPDCLDWIGERWTDSRPAGVGLDGR